MQRTGSISTPKLKNSKYLFSITENNVCVYTYIFLMLNNFQLIVIYKPHLCHYVKQDLLFGGWGNYLIISCHWLHNMPSYWSHRVCDSEKKKLCYFTLLLYLKVRKNKLRQVTNFQLRCSHVSLKVGVGGRIFMTMMSY